MGNFETEIRHYDSVWISFMTAILIFFIISSLKLYVGLSCNFVEDIGTIWILRFARIMHSYFSK